MLNFIHDFESPVTGIAGTDRVIIIRLQGKQLFFIPVFFFFPASSTSLALRLQLGLSGIPFNYWCTGLIGKIY